jgi:peptidoglycan/LPS O-acetylase OafA/YrhL
LKTGQYRRPHARPDAGSVAAAGAPVRAHDVQGAAATPRVAPRLTWVVVLRGFAAMWVFVYHLWHALGGVAIGFGFPTGFTFGLRSLFRAGYQGVDLFFVLSGFVIAWPYVEAAASRMRGVEVIDFYRRRYFRIAPLYYVTIAVVVILLHFDWLDGRQNLRIVVAHLLFLENYVPAWVTTLRGVYWTLPTEIGFYLAFPLLLPLIDRDRPWRFAAAAIAIAIAYRVGTAWSTLHEGVSLAWTSGYLPGRIDQFALGMAAACALATGASTAGGPSRMRVVGTGLAALFVIVVNGRQAGGLDAWYALGPSAVAVAIAAFILVLGRHVHARHRDAAAPRGVVTTCAMRLGEASFGIYLWHTVFIDLAIEASRRLSATPQARTALVLASVPVTIAVALATWRWIEAPCIAYSRRLGRRAASRRRALAA